MDKISGALFWSDILPYIDAISINKTSIVINDIINIKAL